MGFRIPKCSTTHFHNLDTASWPKELNDIAWPMMKNIEQLAITIKTYEKKIRELAQTPTFKAQVDRLMEIHYVGLYVATGFVAVTGGDMDRFTKPRDVGPWLGLSPKQDQSGDIDRQCHITKAGSKMLRWKLTECAQRVLQKNSADMDLKVKGLRIRARGGKIAKGKSITAVARGLAVLMVAMLKKPDVPYVPLSEDKAKELAQIRAAMAAA
jgi:transposase